MPFRMPKIKKNITNQKHIEILSLLTDHKGLLVTCPKFYISNYVKLIHNEILKQLYRDTRWKVPVYHAWYMPHVINPSNEEQQEEIKKFVSDLIQSNVFEVETYE